MAILAHLILAYRHLLLLVASVLIELAAYELQYVLPIAGTSDLNYIDERLKCDIFGIVVHERADILDSRLVTVITQ